MSKIKAVFLDRDGTVNEEKGYVYRFEDLDFIGGAVEAMRLLTENGIKIYIVTNQSGIARGFYTEQDFMELTAKLLNVLESRGTRVEEVLYCPHHPQGRALEYAVECDCRKPNTALIEGVMKRYDYEPQECALVGDKNSDIEAGRRLGIETYLVLTGYGAEHQHDTKATYVVSDLSSAAAHIVKESTGRADERADIIVLAGGLGTRLGDVAGKVPKALAAVNGTPFLDLTLARLDDWERTGKVVIATGYRGDQIRDRYESARFRFEIGFSWERELLGTGGAIKKALKYTATDRVLTLNGDSYVDIDLEDLWRQHAAGQADMTMVLTQVEDSSRFGSVVLGEETRIIRFEEKRGSNADQGTVGLVNAGVYLFERHIFDRVDDGTKVSLETELLPAFLCNRVCGYTSSGRFIDIGTPEAYRTAGTYLEGVLNG